MVKVEEEASEEAEEVGDTVVEDPGTAGVDGEDHIQDHMGVHHTVEIMEDIVAIELPARVDLDLVCIMMAKAKIFLVVFFSEKFQETVLNN